MVISRVLKGLQERFLRNRKTLLLCLGTAFLFGFLTHGYMYFSNAISHDSLYEFIANERIIDWKLGAGRIFVPVYEFLVRGFITVPPLIGILSLLFIGISVFIIVKIFNIQSTTLIIFTAGILTANESLISLNGTYINDADYDMFGLLLAILSVYLWKQNRGKKTSYLFGSIPLVFSIGLYQTYLSVAITLILFVLILEGLRGEDCKKLLIDGVKGIAMLLCAGVAYFICLKVVLGVSGITERDGYNSLERMTALFPIQIFSVLARAYLRSAYHVFLPISIFSTATNVLLNGIFLALVAVLVCKQAFRKEVSNANRFLCLGLILLLPLGMNVCEVLANRPSHELMLYAVCLTYLFGLLMVQEVVEQNVQHSEENAMVEEKGCLREFFALVKPVCYLLVAIVLFGNVRLANTFYSLKEHQKDATMSLMTRVVDDIEACEGYVVGETEVVFVGEIEEQFLQSEVDTKLEELYLYYSSIGIGSQAYYQSYFEYVLRVPILMASNQKRAALIENQKVKDMPVYPNAGSVQMVEGMVVVKWSNIKADE